MPHLWGLFGLYTTMCDLPLKATIDSSTLTSRREWNAVCHWWTRWFSILNSLSRSGSSGGGAQELSATGKYCKISSNLSRATSDRIPGSLTKLYVVQYISYLGSFTTLCRIISAKKPFMSDVVTSVHRWARERGPSCDLAVDLVA